MKIILTCFLAVLGLLSLSGCSSVRPPLELEADRKLEVTHVEPSTSGIEADLLYVLLASEIAGQRGQLGVALDGYMKVARLTQDANVAERAAKIAWFAQKQVLSGEALKIWLAGEPNSVEANRLKVAWLLVNGSQDQAFSQVNRLLSLNEVDLKKEFLALVQRIGKMPNSEQGLAFMARIVAHHEKDAVSHYAYSLLAFHKEKMETALFEVKLAQQLNVGWVEAIVLESQIRVKQGQVAEAVGVIERALELESNSSKLRMLQAQLMLGSGDSEGAEGQFRSVLRQEPENYDVLFSLGLLELQRGEREAAKEKFERTAVVAKWMSQSSFYLGRLAFEDKVYREAIGWFVQVKRGRLYLDAQLGMAQALALLGQFTEMQSQLSGLRKGFPDSKLRLYLIEGELLREGGLHQVAFDLYSEAIGVKPDEMRLFYARSLVAESLGRIDLLEADLLTVLAAKPDDASALNALGYTLSNRTERFDEAEVYLHKALKLKPEDAAILDSYGWLQFKKGRFEEALGYLQKAYNLSQDAEIAAHLGEVFWVLGKKEEAKKVWQKAAKLAPNNHYLQALKERFKEAF